MMYGGVRLTHFNMSLNGSNRETICQLIKEIDMRFRITPTLLLGTSLLGSTLISAAFARDSDDQKKAGNDYNSAAKDTAAVSAAANVIHKFYPPTAKPPFAWKILNPNDPSARIHAAAEAVRDAKDSKEKEDAQKKLADVLSKSYDEDMANREKELAQVEERLKKLRDLLERRRAKKQEIVELQTKVALNEAEGLGFYDGERGPKGPLNITGTVRGAYVGPGSDMLFEVPQVAPPAAPAAAPGVAPASVIPR
jgi:hypothetical protein